MSKKQKPNEKKAAAAIVKSLCDAFYAGGDVDDYTFEAKENAVRAWVEDWARTHPGADLTAQEEMNLIDSIGEYIVRPAPFALGAKYERFAQARALAAEIRAFGRESAADEHTDTNRAWELLTAARKLLARIGKEA